MIDKIKLPIDDPTKSDGLNKLDVKKRTSSSQRGDTFKEAFASARASGEDVFTWNFKEYNTRYKEEGEALKNTKQKKTPLVKRKTAVKKVEPKIPTTVTQPASTKTVPTEEEVKIEETYSPLTWAAATVDKEEQEATSELSPFISAPKGLLYNQPSNQVVMSNKTAKKMVLPQQSEDAQPVQDQHVQNVRVAEKSKTIKYTEQPEDVRGEYDKWLVSNGQEPYYKDAVIAEHAKQLNTQHDSKVASVSAPENTEEARYKNIMGGMSSQDNSAYTDIANEANAATDIFGSALGGNSSTAGPENSTYKANPKYTAPVMYSPPEVDLTEYNRYMTKVYQSKNMQNFYRAKFGGNYAEKLLEMNSPEKIRPRGNNFNEFYVPTMSVRNKNDKSFTEKGRSITNEASAVILHHTAFMDDDLTNAVYELATRDKETGAHVLIGFDGTRVRLADPDQVTFHAGKSVFNGREGVNDFSIGVEFQGNTDEGDAGAKPLTEKQISSAVEYLKPIIQKYNIKFKNITSHEIIRNLYRLMHPEDKEAFRKGDVSKKEFARVSKIFLEKLYASSPKLRGGGVLYKK